MIPQLRVWHERYQEAGLTIVGVHCPELGWERPYESVVAATKKLGVRYPVVQDNDFVIWKRWGVWAWPSSFLVDKKGVVRATHVGEGAYEATEALIRRLLMEPA